VLLLGESGVGKDVLAHYIHQMSERSRTGSFVKINCGAIPENLLESELFGYEAGAFTGARQKGKPGLFEVAHLGTLFLDEIGEIPPSLQVKLLGVLQDQRIQRIGGLTPIEIDARVITATNANLLQLVQENRFRKDLYYRINVISIAIPPLRRRPEDILALILYFLEEFNQKYQVNKTMDAQLIKAMLEYSWPGNVRELRNTVERLVVVSEGEHIGLDDLPEPIQEELQRLGGQEAFQPVSQEGPDMAVTLRHLEHTSGLKEVMEQMEKAVLAHFLRRYRPLKLCAHRLGIDLSTLMRKKKRYGL
jgi:transcriptional regulator with PAS, ATPase and Fis domain